LIDWARNAGPPARRASSGPGRSSFPPRDARIRRPRPAPLRLLSSSDLCSAARPALYSHHRWTRLLRSPPRPLHPPRRPPRRKPWHKRFESTATLRQDRSAPHLGAEKRLADRFRRWTRPRYPRNPPPSQSPA
jgi:hypothetical protein